MLLAGCWLPHLGASVQASSLRSPCFSMFSISAGKTIQCAAFLAGLIESRLIRRAIVVAPKTLLAQWRKELGVCGLQGHAHEYGGTANERCACACGCCVG